MRLETLKPFVQWKYNNLKISALMENALDGEHILAVFSKQTCIYKFTNRIVKYQPNPLI